MKPIHLCLLGDADHVHVRRWAHEMCERGLRVSVVTARPGPLQGVEQRVLAPVRQRTDWLLRAGEARRHVTDLAPDLVHAHYITSYGYLAARCRRHPMVMTAWGSDILVSPRESRAVRWLTGWTLRRADLVTGDSLDLVQAIRGYRPDGPVEHIHWGADTDRFRPVPWGDKRGFEIASLRSWDANYRIDTIVRALGLMLERHPELPARLHLLGGGPQEQDLRDLVRELGLGDQVSFHGRLDEAAMLEVMQRCKVSVSVPASDATSVSLLESMACGLPVIASDLPANREWLGADEDVLVATGDAAALADALAALWRDDARAARIGQRNAQRIARDGTRAAQMDAVVVLYETLLARTGGARS